MRQAQWTRRRFLGRGVNLAFGAAAAPYMLTRRTLGQPEQVPPSERIAIGFIGVGGMGRGHLGLLLTYPDVQIVGIADVWQESLTKAQEMIVNAYGQPVPTYTDYRELLARDDVDAVVIATPDHWHTLTAIHACQAGKDVYCEKPLTLTIREGRRIVQAVRRNATVFQVGSQQRSSDNFRYACELVRSGRIGRLESVRATIGGGPVTGYEKPEEPPPGLEWDFWLGPAPWAAYTPRRCHYTFRWIYDYSGGKMTDWGAHHNDIAQWGIGADGSGPVKTEPVSATFPTEGLYNTATRFEVKHTYANGVVLHTVSHGGNGVRFQGTDGWIEVNRGYFATSDPEIESTPLGAGDVHLYKSPGHHRDWLNCIRSREQPICDVEIGVRSVTVCHLGTIALRTGKTIEWDPSTEDVTNDDSLRRWLDKPYRAPWRI